MSLFGNKKRGNGKESLILYAMKKIPVIKFFKRKYGKELLIDLNDLYYIKPGIVKCPVHRYTFYSLVLITDGKEEIGINDSTIVAEKGTFIAGIPGDVWNWNSDTQLQGYMLIFEEEFLLSFFNDRLFLQKFPYLQRNRHSPFYRIRGVLYDRIYEVMKQIREEIHGDEADLHTTSLPEIDSHILRAMLYEVLTLIKRAAESVIVSDEQENSLKRYVEPFIRLVEDNFIENRSVSFYADSLCITPNYLNKIIKQALGTNAKAYINDRIVREIKQMLDYTSLSVAEIAENLHFLSSSYLVRYFRSQTGITPVQYRNKTTSG